VIKFRLRLPCVIFLLNNAPQILARSTTIYDNIARDVAEDKERPRPHFTIRNQPRILGVLYQGDINEERRREIKKRFENNTQYQPQFPQPQKQGDKTEAMGSWISQYRECIISLVLP
jgi:hypothetical protein